MSIETGNASDAPYDSSLTSLGREGERGFQFMCSWCGDAIDEAPANLSTGGRMTNYGICRGCLEQCLDQLGAAAKRDVVPIRSARKTNRR